MLESNVFSTNFGELKLKVTNLCYNPRGMRRVREGSEFRRMLVKKLINENEAKIQRYPKIEQSINFGEFLTNKAPRKLRVLTNASQEII